MEHGPQAQKDRRDTAPYDVDGSAIIWRGLPSRNSSGGIVRHDQCLENGDPERLCQDGRLTRLVLIATLLAMEVE
jgi:hypothetical protein